MNTHCVVRLFLLVTGKLFTNLYCFAHQAAVIELFLLLHTDHLSITTEISAHRCRLVDGKIPPKIYDYEPQPCGSRVLLTHCNTTCPALSRRINFLCNCIPCWDTHFDPNFRFRPWPGPTSERLMRPYNIRKAELYSQQ